MADSTDFRKTGTQDDSAVLTRLKNGDVDAFESIYLSWHKPVYQLMCKVTRNEQDAEDIAQDVFTHLWNMRDRIVPGGNLKALLFIIARRSAVRLFYRFGLHDSYVSAQEDNSDVDTDPGELLIAQEMKLMTQCAIERMNGKQREVFKLYYYEHLSTSEIAEKLGLTNHNVSQHIHNGKKNLREMLMLFIAFLVSNL